MRRSRDWLEPLREYPSQKSLWQYFTGSELDHAVAKYRFGWEPDESGEWYLDYEGRRTVRIANWQVSRSPGQTAKAIEDHLATVENELLWFQSNYNLKFVNAKWFTRTGWQKRGIQGRAQTWPESTARCLLGHAWGVVHKPRVGGAVGYNWLERLPDDD